ncbi:autotransporter domain-containing protein [Sphingomonas sp.]|uniref:autotransporter domain-containing protein n=1 Tax=Sphingomonas sp. TaxID=28214 RepID=UPI001D2C63FF|nr:autotransporter domain-containing protein [Sphingomonas sp.]MBX9797762.1 autotransporter domain-containing protein [Sphingomonas sp.]
MTNSTAAIRRIRPYLMGSAACLGLMIGTAAQAQTSALTPSPATGGLLDRGEAVLEAHGSSTINRDQAVLEPHDTSALPPAQRLGYREVQLDPNILIALPGTPTTARDPNNITGVAQMIVAVPNATGGVGLGLCTGSLINPRTVLFAAHCVNTRPANAYGSGSGGVAIGFAFNNSNNTTQPGQPAGSSPLLNWVFGVTGRPAFTTSITDNFYTVNGVAYNQLSLLPESRGFLFGDVAIASLDTPARNIPTLSLLFSPLPAPGAITAANGTGYSVQLVGYGGNGTGVSGTQPIDYRRRLADNWLGGLASLADFEGAVFGPGSSAGLPQNLYWIDFDDPARGTGGASPFDFNAWRDNARTTEGTTAGGDSGGPLILDRAFARQLVIGVLSGGYTRFFTAQPANGYGTASFYQPLYLYWDWIAANNPYRYVGAVAGDGNWNDPTRWVSLQDPNYFILGANGQPINGVPNLTGEENTGTAGKFGQVCIQGGITGAIGNNVCRDVRTGGLVNTPGGIGTAADQPAGALDNNMGSALISGPGAANQPADTILTGGAAQLEPQAPAVATPAPTIANGLPGATNFVPNNLAGNRTAGTLPRYFDVTLSNTGTITLDTAVTIDRFRLNGVGARLNIAAAGSLTTLNDATLQIGTLQVLGSLVSRNDLNLVTGGLNGTGTITAPFITNIAATISPGATGNPGSIGTLTFNGDLVLGVGSNLLIDLGANGVSDLVRVQPTAGPPAATGRAAVGGLVIFNTTNDLRANNLYTFLTAAGGVTGTFLNSAPFSAILSPQFIYNPTSVQVFVRAGLYQNVVNINSPVQLAFATLLDENRGNNQVNQAIFSGLDLQNAATIRAQLDAMAPRAEALLPNLGIAAIDNMSRFHRDRIVTREAQGAEGGSIAVIGQPLQLASAANGFGGLAGMGGGFGGAIQASSDAAATTVKRGALPDDLNAFLAGGYITGSSRSARDAVNLGGRDTFNGFYFVGGIEKDLGADGFIGVSFGYSQLAGNTVDGLQRATVGLYEGTVYSKVNLGKGWSIDGQTALGLLNTTTLRNVNLVGNQQALRTGDNSITLSSEVGGQKELLTGFLKLTPRVSVRSSYIDFSSVVPETGGGSAALVFNRPDMLSIQGRAGFGVTTGTWKNLRPFATANFVYEFNNTRADLVRANLLNSGTLPVVFRGGRVDRAWGEISGGITYVTGRWEFSVAADTTVARDDVRNQAYRGSVRFRF